MKYIARDESRVANIARGEAKCYIICHKTLSNSNISSIGLYITFVMVTCFEAPSDNCFTFSSAWQAFICIVSSLRRVVSLSCWDTGTLSSWDTGSLPLSEFLGGSAGGITGFVISRNAIDRKLM